MKRTPAWVFVAAVGIQLAALCLCAWAMEHVLGFEEEPPAAPPAPAPPEPAARRDPPPAPPRPQPRPQPEPAPRPVSAWRPEPDGPPRHVTIRAVTVPPPQPPVIPSEPLVPRFGPPPERPAAPPGAIAPFLTDPADATTSIVGGGVNGGSLAFGFYSDGGIRLVDVDGGRYAGKAESARARMREVDGMRAFTVQIGMGADGRLTATFTGGTHDAETITLEPLVGWSAV